MPVQSIADARAFAAFGQGLASGFEKRQQEIRQDAIIQQEMQIREAENRRAQQLHDAQMKRIQQREFPEKSKEHAFRQASWEFFDRSENWFFHEGTPAWVLLDQQSQLLQKTYPDMPPHEVLRRARAATVAILGLPE